MSASINPNHPNSLNPAGASGGASKSLWAVIGFLGAAVLALGGALFYVSHQSERVATGTPAAVGQGVPGANPVALPALAQATQPGGATSAAAPAAAPGMVAQDEVGKPATAAKKAAPVAKAAAPKHDRAAAAGPAPANPAGAGAGGAPGVVAAAPAVAAQPPVAAKPVCGNCGTVEAATPVQREHSGIGVGAVAGGVLGAVVGNQVGAGSGKTAATVLGALGGGWAGNEVEKRMKKVTVYDVRVRMEDGNTRSFELATPVGAGAKVTVEGKALRLADGSLAAPLPPPPQAQAVKSGPNQSAY